jgi:hypothetical protein
MAASSFQLKRSTSQETRPGLSPPDPFVWHPQRQLMPSHTSQYLAIELIIEYSGNVTDYQHLGPDHPKVLSAAAAFDAWWDKYQPVAYLTEATLTNVPEGVDPDSIWTEFDGEYGETFVPGLHQSGQDYVSGYWFTSRPCSEEDKGAMVITEVRQYCENHDDVTCSDCPMEKGLCSGIGNQWCEIPNIRYPGGAPAYSLEGLLETMGQGSGGDA